MSDADSAGSHGRAGKALKSTGGRVARVWKQFEAARGVRFARRGVCTFVALCNEYAAQQASLSP